MLQVLFDIILPCPLEQLKKGKGPRQPLQPGLVLFKNGSAGLADIGHEINLFKRIIPVDDPTPHDVVHHIGVMPAALEDIPRTLEAVRRRSQL